FLGREVPEEGARRYLGGLRDLLDGGGGVTVFLDQPKRLPPDGLAGSDLLAFPQTGDLVCRLHDVIVAHRDHGGAHAEWLNASAMGCSRRSAPPAAAAGPRAHAAG